MNKISVSDLDIPVDDIDCWERYPKHRWVYELSRLLDSQNIKWRPFETDEFDYSVPSMSLISAKKLNIQPATIYIEQNSGQHTLTELFIVKGEIKHIRHIDQKTKQTATQIIGNIELRLNAFVSLYFAKFSGIISCETQGNDIYAIRLMAQSDLSAETNSEIIKLVKRIYKRTNSTIIGLADQELHDSFAS